MRIVAWAVLLATGPVGPAGDKPPAKPAGPTLRRYEIPEYVIHTDLPPEAAREVSARMSAIAAEYGRRAKGFGKLPEEKLSLYLFTRREDYYRAGGVPGTAGFYTGRALVASTLGERDLEALWMTLQHEGFHQFVDRVVGGRWPVWLNEGLAEYFALGIWTGDGFVMGAVPPEALQRVQALIRGGKAVAPDKMLAMAAADWRKNVQGARYDQAWSMVYFLIHGDQGRYRGALGGFIEDVAASRPGRQAFEQRFGKNYAGFRGKWEAYWLGQGPSPTKDLYTQSVVATLTSFLARAHLQGLRFESVEAFFHAAGAGKIDTTPRGYEGLFLPAGLLKIALARIRGWEVAWSLETRASAPALKMVAGDKTFLGTFTLRGEKRPEVKVTLTGAGKNRLRK